MNITKTQIEQSYIDNKENNIQLNNVITPN